ncbi:MAG: DUF354 domain-containing protein [Proteobacteria bacterium]|nr:DUF354 domain-containing protein [Pseudomonadota bacterium]MBU1709205.1 DUF354 domain-containing protein [Pseudomonadota bacterium]
MKTALKKKIWIDLDNTPHVPFFKPIIEELEKKNYDFTMTARKCFQVCGLADLVGMKYTPIGRHYGKHKIMKIVGTLIRVVQMIPTILREKPDIAVSHGSRTQQIVANFLRIPNIVIFDYEHTTGLMFFHPTCVVVPEIIVNGVRERSKSQVHSYPGIKEDVYVPGFKPDSSILETLGLNQNDIVAVIRPPASEAHYRSPESEKLFAATVESLAAMAEVKMVMLPRNERQEEQIRADWPGLFSNKKIIIPKEVVDGLNLIWHADFVISGGGTMNREAAALGVPVFSIFRGKTGAVDQYLQDQGRLTLLESVEDVLAKIKPIRRNKENDGGFGARPALQKIVSVIEKLAQES